MGAKSPPARMAWTWKKPEGFSAVENLRATIVSGKTELSLRFHASWWWLLDSWPAVVRELREGGYLVCPDIPQPLSEWEGAMVW